ncbi:MAG: hypothetical protein WBV82_20725 [Myxococcaceae bacterium]
MSRVHVLFFPMLLLFACSDCEAPSAEATRAPAQQKREPLSHRTPYVPPQCYTKTQGADGRVHNPCYVCHQSSTPPNYINDPDVQLAYAFPEPALVNPWTNLFVDRRKAVAAISDEEILGWVRQSNYFDADGRPLLSKTLADVPTAWDVNGNGKWEGWVPDLHFRFDDLGFDRRGDGSYTGWRAYGYFPFPGTFWPTNGSFGDAMIRLPAPFRQNLSGKFDRNIYELNLAITESLIARRDVKIPSTDETQLGVDLDGDGQLGTADKVKYRWTPGEGTPMTWVGAAQKLQDAGKVHLLAGLFPEGTELAHGVYYLDVVDGRPTLAKRMKELRYMVKAAWLSYGDHELAATNETMEALEKPDATRRIEGNAEVGVGNRAGWRLQGFIEDADGALRPQTREEHGYCLGCHSGVAATDDSVFSFGRKLPDDAFQGGWFHGSQRDLRGLPEPLRADGQPEYAHYLQHNGAGDEFRANTEVLERFFTSDGKLNEDALRALRSDISTLLLPSPERALNLNKAYRVIVREQSFIRGRDATVAPSANVHRDLSTSEEELTTGITQPL